MNWGNIIMDLGEIVCESMELAQDNIQYWDSFKKFIFCSVMFA